MRIAVICGPGIHAAIDWTVKYAAEHYQIIQQVSIARSTIYTDKCEYKIIQAKSDINGQEFNGYIVCPTYEDLVALVKERVRLEEANNV